MAKKNYEALADEIIEVMGGKENMTFFIHCLTRLRFNVKDKGLIDNEKLKNIKGVVGSQWQGDQFQIIIGQHVGDVYKVICQKAGFEVKEIIKEDADVPKKKLSISLIFDSISGCVTPLLPLIIGGGLIKAVLLILLQFKLISVESSTYMVLSFTGDAAFYFLPVFLGATGAKKFGANMGYGMLLGATLIHPQFIEAISKGTALSIYNIPIHAASYASTIFPMILATFVLSYVEKYITKFTPQMLKSLVVPLFTLLIMLPLTLCVLAPMGSVLGSYLSTGITWLYDTTGFLAVGVVCGVYVFLCMTGMHTALLPILFTMLATVGYEPITVIASMLYTINQGVVTLVVAAKTKDKDVKSEALTCTITSFVAGISEPALFGFSLKNKKLLYCSMIGCFCGGIYAGLMKVYCFAVAGTVGFLGLPGFIGSDSMNLINMIIAIAISCIVTFVLGIKFVYQNKEEIKC